MSLDLEKEYDKIYKYCYFKLGNSVLAEDVTQDTFLKFFAQNSYIERGKLLAYLYTIAKNLCTESYGQKEELELKDDIKSNDKSMESLEIKLSVSEALAKLPQKDQELIVLRYINNLSLYEISQITGLSRFAIYRRNNASLENLKQFLRKEDFLE